jgi:hypothetical protein
VEEDLEAEADGDIDRAKERREDDEEDTAHRDEDGDPPSGPVPGLRRRSHAGCLAP